MTPEQHPVLVVEDDDEARAVLLLALEAEGFAVLGFPNGAEALDYLRTSDAPCLIAMDMRMPVMDGPTFRAALLQDARLAQIPVIVVTAYDPAIAVGLAALRVFRKPLDLTAFLDFVRKYC